MVLMQDLTGASLKAGDVGTIVRVHQGGAGYEVEFMTLAGETITVVTLLPLQIRAISRRDVARRLRIDLDMRPLTASPARTALPAAHFERNETQGI